MNHCRGLLILSLALLVVIFATNAFAGVPLVTSYQGRLLDATDNPLTGSYSMTFQIYDALDGGAPLWTEDHVGVQVTDGLFSVALGSTVPLSADLLTGGGGGGGGGVVRYLQIQISGQPPISPRTPLSAAPYAVASGSVSGDIQTESGVLRVRHNLGSSGEDGVEIAADGSSSSLHSRCIGSSGEDGVSIDASPLSSKLHVSRPIGESGQDGVSLFVVNDSSTIVVGDPNGASVVSSVTNLGGGASTAAYAATGRMTPSGLDQVKWTVDAQGPSIAIDESGVHVARIAADNESTYTELSGRRPGRVKYGDITLKADGDESRFVQVADVDGDGVPESSVMSSSSATSAKHAINTKGTGGNTGRTVRATTDSIAAASSVEADLDGDGLADNIVASSADATDARMAINTKGTGATLRSATLTVSGTPGGSANAVCAADVDGDGVPESSVSSSADDASARVAIKTKGTGAEANKSASLTVTGSPGGSAISAVCGTDVDGDGTPENFSSQVCNADSVYHEVSVSAPQPGGFVALMKAKEKANRTKCSSSLRYSAPSSSSGKDDDCDGFSASRSLFFDSDGDGAPENGIQEVCLPTSCSVAIQTKGTGADKNRAASLACIADVDGNGTVDRSVSTTADSTTAGIAIDEPGVHIATEARKGWDGTIKGNIAIDESGVHRVLFDSDGNGFFASKVGIGVDTPTHSIDVAGGAYCDGTNWVNASDANVKENFQPINGSELLDQIEQLAISKWNYKGDANMTHIGPTAQDFQAAFGVGSDGKSISTIDPAGIALAAAKELRIELKDKTQQINDLQNKLQQLQALVERLLAEKK